MAKTVASLRRARFDYEILETFESGIVLSGQEVKSCRQGGVDLSGSYIGFTKQGKPVLKQATIAPYKFATVSADYEPIHDRPLLLKDTEIEKLRRAVDEKGVTVLPLEVTAGKYIKLKIGIARGRKTIDKRRVIKEREMEKKLRRGEEY